MLICILIWLFAFLLSSPLFLFNKTNNFSVSFNDDESLSLESISFNSNLTYIPIINDSYVYSVDHCVEDWKNHQARMVYSYSSLLIQYIMPIIIVGLAYSSIWWKLKKNRTKLKQHKECQIELIDKTNKKNEYLTTEIKYKQKNIEENAEIRKKSSIANEQAKKRKKMNVLLMSIALIFALSWLPLNIFNIISDLKLNIIKAGHTYFLINAVCILLGMSSAVSNPCLYGVLNENFKREYSRLFNVLFIRFYSNVQENTHNINNIQPNTSHKVNEKLNSKELDLTK